MTFNNWEMIAETRSYVFRWRSLCRRCGVCLSSLLGEFKRKRRERQRKLRLEITIWEMVLFCDYCFFFESFIVGRARFKWIGRCAVGVKIKKKNERFTVVCSPCRSNLKFGNFTSSFSRLLPTNCTKLLAARAAGLYFLIQLIGSLFSGVVVAMAVVAMAVVFALTPC